MHKQLARNYRFFAYFAAYISHISQHTHTIALCLPARRPIVAWCPFKASSQTAIQDISSFPTTRHPLQAHRETTVDNQQSKPAVKMTACSFTSPASGLLLHIQILLAHGADVDKVSDISAHLLTHWRCSVSPLAPGMSLEAPRADAQAKDLHVITK